MEKYNSFTAEASAVQVKDDRIEKFVNETMEFYNDLSPAEQIELFLRLSDSFLRHREGMINDCVSDLKMMDERRMQLEKGAEIIKTRQI